VRILFVSEKCGYFGGVEQNVAVSVGGLREMGHECFIAFGEKTEKESDKYAQLFDDALQCREMSSPNAVELARPFLEIVERVSPDVLYLHKVRRTDFCLPFVGKLRIVRMVHDHDLCCPRRHKYYFHNEKVCRSKAGWRCYMDLAFLARNSSAGRSISLVSITEKLREMRRNYKWDLLLVGSRFMRDELIQNRFPASKVHILPPVVPWRQEVQTPVPSDPIVLCVAQLIRGKGVDLLLRALQGLSCDYQAMIVGTGNAEQDLKALSRTLGLGDRVCFQGWLDNKAITRFYSRSRVIAFPSRWPEPFGMIGLEAMQHGRAVVGFDVGGVSDWLEHEVTGLLVPEADVEAFGNALQRVLTDSDLAERLGRTALVRARERFSFENYIEYLEHFLVGTDTISPERVNNALLETKESECGSAS